MKKIFITILLVLIPCSSFSTVWLLNGNFSVTYTDVDEGNGFVLERYYNSLSAVKGIFGHGWGTQLETRVYIVEGPFIMVEEVSGGGRSFYISKGISLDALADKYLSMMNAQSKGKDYVDNLKKALLKDPSMLFDYARGFILKSKLNPGAILQGVSRPTETIQVTKNGYLREGPAGVQEEFDKEGRIIRRTPKVGVAFSYRYNVNGRLRDIKDSLGRTMEFFFNNKGLLERIKLFNNKFATYIYDEQENLVQSTDAEGKIYKYKYDSYHRLTEMLIPAGDMGPEPATWNIAYDSGTGKVTYQKTPEGWEIFYEYAGDKGTVKEQYYESVSVIKKFANQVFSEKYEFWKRPGPDGTLYMYKSREKIGKNEKTVTYTMCCGTPLVVNENGKITRYEYDKNGNLKKKVYPDGRVIGVTYDDNKRVTSVVNNGTPYMFKYNDKDQIIMAASKMLQFKMDYNRNGDIIKIIDNKGNNFTFNYDSSGRLVGLSSGNTVMNIEQSPSGVPIIRELNNPLDNAKIWELRKTYIDYIELMSMLSLVGLEQ